jgi:hypothetical protein
MISDLQSQARNSRYWVHSGQRAGIMTLGNMRANGVRTLAALCLGRGCDDYRGLDVGAYPDGVPVPSNYM